MSLARAVVAMPFAITHCLKEIVGSRKISCMYRHVLRQWGRYKSVEDLCGNLHVSFTIQKCNFDFYVLQSTVLIYNFQTFHQQYLSQLLPPLWFPLIRSLSRTSAAAAICSDACSLVWIALILCLLPSIFPTDFRFSLSSLGKKS